jgi:N utilization substance protein A
MLQRLRDAEDDIRFGEFSGKEGDIISGVIQQGRNPDDVMVDLGKLEALLPVASGCPGRATSTAPGSSAWCSRSARACAARRSRCRARTPNLVKKLFALEVPEIADGTVEIAAIAREAGHRTKIAVRRPASGVNAKGACIGPMGQRVRNVMSELHGEKIDIVDWSEDPAELVAHALSPARVSSVEIVDLAARSAAVVVPGLPALPRDRQGGPERPPRRAPHRLAHRHPVRRGERAHPRLRSPVRYLRGPAR